LGAVAWLDPAEERLALGWGWQRRLSLTGRPQTERIAANSKTKSNTGHSFIFSSMFLLQHILANLSPLANCRPSVAKSNNFGTCPAPEYEQFFTMVSAPP